MMENRKIFAIKMRERGFFLVHLHNRRKSTGDDNFMRLYSLNKESDGIVAYWWIRFIFVGIFLLTNRMTPDFIYLAQCWVSVLQNLYITLFDDGVHVHTSVFVVVRVS